MLNKISIFGIFSLVHNVFGGTFSVDYTNHVFLKDGKPFKYISGTMHYFRVHPDLWDDRLKRIRSLGLNAIQTYTPWNLHEPTQGNFEFSGFANVTRFLSLAQQNGLYVLLRPGPYIAAEWEQGGLPYWLLKYDGIKMRSSDPNYINAVKKFFNVLLDVVKPFLYENGGPILMLQVENEYGHFYASYGQLCDRNYTTWLRDLMRSKLGEDVVLYTTDVSNEKDLSCGPIPNTTTTVDFAPNRNTTIDHFFDLQDQVSGGAPNVCSEFYDDWYLSWGAKEARNITSIPLLVESLSYIYNRNGSSNLYLALASTNFDFNSCGLVETSYWVGAPISENGDITEKFLAIRSFISSLSDWDYPPTSVPNNNSIVNYGQVTMTRVGANLLSTLTQIQETCIQSLEPLTFELIDHPYGYVLYSTTLKIGGKTLSAPNINDNGYVFLNNNYQGMLRKDQNITNITLTTMGQPGDLLRILVENQGRLCNVAIADIKGLHNNVTLGGNILQNWYQCGINLTKASVDSLVQKNFQENFDFNTTAIISGVSKKMGTSLDATFQPGVFIGTFNASSIEDTFVDTTGWGKGQLFINGYNLGRYWPTAGPQMTLYVPKPFLQTANTILLIELNGAQQNYVNFSDHPIFIFKNSTLIN